MRVQMLRLMANPEYGTAPAGAIIDLPTKEAHRRIAAGDCKPLEDSTRPTRATPRVLDRTPGTPPATPITPATPPPVQTPDVPVEKMTTEQLRAYAAKEEIDLGSATRKDEIRTVVLAELERRRDADGD
ncbi:hypothetical protein [Streptomyces sp. CA-146814]|uniref:hypothetical protein n=1 Tax=Streptomyces sp. CA-146814 TaxID=3240053 RepID=UPI003D8F52BE